MHVHFVVAVHFDMESFHFFARLETCRHPAKKNIMATWFKPISLQDILILIFYDLSYVKTMLSFPFGSKNVHIFLIITRVAIVLFVVKSGFLEQQLSYTRNWHKTDFAIFESLYTSFH